MVASQRLQKYMASCGAGSRRECETFIEEGRVEVNGVVVTEQGVLVEPGVDEVRLDGQRLRAERLVHYLLHKPRGVICSSRGAPRAIDYAPPEAANLRLFTIGRLDVESEGAIILTNDGELTHLVSHPRFEVSKTYRVDVEGHPDDATLRKMRDGVWLSEGKTGGAKVRVVKRTKQRSTLEVQLKEGRHREVRRICARLGHEVKRLVRTKIGPVELGRMVAGRVRKLTDEEIGELRDSARVLIRLGQTPKSISVAREQRRHQKRPGGSRGARGESKRPGSRGKVGKKKTAKKKAGKRPATEGRRGQGPGSRGKPTKKKTTKKATGKRSTKRRVTKKRGGKRPPRGGRR